jgi:hypothetical protein
MLERERRMSTPPVTGPLIPVEPKKRAGLDFRVYLDLKIGIHRELLNHLNLEKVADVTRRSCKAPGIRVDSGGGRELEDTPERS